MSEIEFSQHFRIPTGNIWHDYTFVAYVAGCENNGVCDPINLGNTNAGAKLNSIARVADAITRHVWGNATIVLGTQGHRNVNMPWPMQVKPPFACFGIASYFSGLTQEYLTPGNGDCSSQRPPELPPNSCTFNITSKIDLGTIKPGVEGIKMVPFQVTCARDGMITLERTVIDQPAGGNISLAAGKTGPNACELSPSNPLPATIAVGPANCLHIKYRYSKPGTYSTPVALIWSVQ
ncbi:hypothetical protein C9426_28035 [Serratia sp. S1B]|nr:hypothetical protein C9426_28035 [Serratia sp. S1B]